MLNIGDLLICHFVSVMWTTDANKQKRRMRNSSMLKYTETYPFGSNCLKQKMVGHVPKWEHVSPIVLDWALLLLNLLPLVRIWSGARGSSLHSWGIS